MPCYFSNLVVLADYKSRSVYKYTELSFKKPSKCYNHLSFLILRMFYGFFCYCFFALFFFWWNANIHSTNDIVVLINKTKTINRIYLWGRHITVVSNHVNSDHVPFFSCLDVWANRQATSGVYAITVTTSAYHCRRCGRL